MLEQPPPTASSRSRPVTQEVIRDLLERREHGKTTYGTELKTFNGRKALEDAYMEILDMAVYVKQELMERDNRLEELRGKTPDVENLKTAQDYIAALAFIAEEIHTCWILKGQVPTELYYQIGMILSQWREKGRYETLSS